MRVAMLLGIGSFLLSSLIVGLRMVALGARTGRSAELEMGLALLVPGVAGFTVAMLSLDPELTGVAPSTFRALANSSFAAGAVALALFTRQGVQWTAFVAILCTGIGVSAAGFWIEHPRDLLASPAFWISYVGRMLVYAWAALEALRQYLLGRRRLRLGLAEPLVVNRFLLWAVGNGAVLGMFAIELVSMAEVGLHAMFRPRVMTPISVLGLVAALTVWLAFLPPRAYVRRFAATGAAG